MIVRERLASALSSAVERARESGSLMVEGVPAVKLDEPPSPGLGDFSSDVAVILARQTRQQPLAVAEAVAAHLDVAPELIERVDAAPSGILNFRLNRAWLADVAAEARRRQGDFGKSGDPGAGQSVQVEFVSAYPTGPLTVTHGRGAALGDALANVLEWNGYRVQREFYVNDAGAHMERFARMLEAVHAGAASGAEPADALQRTFLGELAREIGPDVWRQAADLAPERRSALLGRKAAEVVVQRQRAVLERIGVRFDRWYSERGLHESGSLQRVLDRLLQSGQAQRTDEGVWLLSSRSGDTEDHPLLRSNGQATYLAADLAYHLDKFERGFDRVVNVWSADHAGYVERTRAGLRALGLDADRLEIVIFRPVTLKIDGMLVEGSAGRGNNQLLEEVIEEAGPAAVRFLYLQRPAEAPLDLDLDAARQRTPENTPYFIQSVLTAAARRLEGAPAGELDPASLDGGLERSAARKLVDFPDEIRAAGRERDPYRLTRYAAETADVVGRLLSADNGPGAEARLPLLEAAVVVLRNTLAVLGIPS